MSYEYKKHGETYDGHPQYDVTKDSVRLGGIERVRASTDTSIPGTRLRRPGKGRNEWRPLIANWPPRLTYLTREGAARQLEELKERLVKESIAKVGEREWREADRRTREMVRRAAQPFVLDDDVSPKAMAIADQWGWIQSLTRRRYGQDALWLRTRAGDRVRLDD